MRLTGKLWETPERNQAFNAFVREASRANEVGRRFADQEPPTPPTSPSGVPLPGGSGDGGPKGPANPVDPDAQANQLLRDLFFSRRR